MQHFSDIPVFPLAILPLPNELVPLHIFEPRYKQMLKDVEEKGALFGIYYSHGLNKDRMGGIMKLESILKRYETGECDILAKCVDTFLLTQYYNKWKKKLYPGGKVYQLDASKIEPMSAPFVEKFKAYMALKNVTDIDDDFDIHDIANELNLDIGDRIKYLKLLSNMKREKFLLERLKYQKFILQQEQKHKDSFYLN
ncbi:LON peptidase substrate-binding domain-containing protein [Fulvivirga ligni]|uniref:LON peptidase substrate-binding domain-containing protein n=1 Tax=Fulvivirga ligni TaxID=2904246 RepID=UPI001F34911D|nr:LON peptidase substrate-binding domain-containing protein [Fulvivirga ligni]UII23792.1 hypothetical protein LVD16_11220 [Fulvivirga ligni]